MSASYSEYQIRSGDNLSRIIYDMYGWTPHNQPATYKATLEGVLSLNPHIANPDRIVAGQILRLPIHPTSASLRHVRPSILQQEGFISESLPPIERERVTTIAWLSRNTDWLTIPGGVAMGTASGLLGRGNQQLLTDIGDLYADYKAGKLTKGQYDGRRAKKIAEIRRNLGPLEHAVRQKGMRHTLKGGKVLPSDVTRMEAERWKRIAGHAAKGGVVLTGVGVTAACVKIAHTVDMKEKNQVLVETVTSTVVGAGIGIPVGIFLASNPVGWGVVLVLAMGSAFVSWGAGYGATRLYDLKFNHVDLVTGLGVDRVCR